MNARRHRPARTVRRRRAATGFVRAGASLVVLAAAVAGIPTLLLAIGSTPWPSDIPTIGELADQLTRPDDGTLLLGVLTAAAWLGWALFAVSVLVEAAAAVRGRSAPRLPGLGLAQRPAAALVTAAAILFAAGPTGLLTASPAAAGPPPPRTTSFADTGPATAAGTPNANGSGGAVSAGPSPYQGFGGQRAAPDSPTHKEYTVTSADARRGLWGIAERTLGDGLRYREIVTLNRGRPQPGGHTLTTASHIEAGWVLRLPADAKVPDASRPAPAEAERVVVVRPGDTLAEIAERTVGDSAAFPRLADATRGRVQPDGRTLTDPDDIYPGWQIVVPAARDGAGPPPANPETEPTTPAPGAPPADQPTAPATPGRTSPPAPSAPATPSPEAPAATSSSSPTAEASPSAGSAGPVPSTNPTGTSSGPPTPGSPRPATATSPAAATPPAQTAPTAQPAAPPDDWNRGWIALSGLAAAGVLAALGLKRRVQQRRRPPGHRTRLPQTMSDFELAARATEDPASREQLDQGLRSLSAALAAQGRNLPPVRAAAVGRNSIDLILSPSADDAQQPPAAPFAGTHDPLLWRLDPASEALLPAELAADVPAPYPALVSLGHDSSGALVLVDLEDAGAISLLGPAAEIEAVLRALAVELAVSLWADHLVVVLVGFGEQLPVAFGGDRLRYCDGIDAALDDFVTRGRELQQLLTRADVVSVSDARARGVAGDAWTPQIILSAHPLTAEQQQRLARVFAGGRQISLAAVVAASDQELLLPGPWRLWLAGDEPVHIAPLETSLTLQRLADAEYNDLVGDLVTANDTVAVPDSTWSEVPAEPNPPLPPLPAQPADPEDPTDPADVGWRPTVAVAAPHPAPFEPPADPAGPSAGATTDRAQDPVPLPDPQAPEIRLLGPVDILGVDPGKVESNKRNRLVELAAWLILNPGRGPDEVSRVLGTVDRPWSASTRQSNMSRLRNWFGRDPHDEYYVPVITEGHGYRLHQSVRCDWTRFQLLARRGLARGSAGVTELEQALDLVRGQPIGNVPHARYSWADHLKQEMISAVLDVAHAVAVRRLEAGDPVAARVAIAKGLQVEPVSELLYRDLFRAEYRAGNRAGIRDAAARLVELNDACGVEMEPETSALLTELLEGHPSRAL